MLRKSVVPLLVCILSIGCVSTVKDLEETRPTKVFVYSKEESLKYPMIHVSFIEALNEWADLITVDLIFTSDPVEFGIPVKYTDISVDPYDLQNAAGAWYPGCFYCPLGPLIVISNDVEHYVSYPTPYRNAAITVCIHELGHCFGLSHTLPEENSVMDSLTTYSHTLTSKDIRLAADYLGAEVSKRGTVTVK